jgi:hypothetical protein
MQINEETTSQQTEASSGARHPSRLRGTELESSGTNGMTQAPILENSIKQAVREALKELIREDVLDLTILANRQLQTMGAPPGSHGGNALQSPPGTAETARIHALDQMVSGERLLEILWDHSSRPSYRWLQYQCARRAIPFCKNGGRTWFVPRAVREALTRVPVRRGRPSGS